MFHFKKPSLLVFFVTVCAFLLIQFEAFSQSNNSKNILMPYDVFAIKTIEHTKGFTCKKPPEPIADLNIPAYYDQTDDSRSKIQLDVYAKHQELRQPVRDFDNYLTYMTNLYVEGGMKREDVAECAISWIYEWASHDAMLGDMNRTGKQIQKWSLAVYANAYYQIMHSPSLQTHQKIEVERWLKKYAYRVKENYSSEKHRASRNNNHLYWAAWAVGAAGTVLQDKILYDWAIDRATYGLNQIESKGILPLEMDRESKALNYHIFAAHSLVMMAELSRVNEDVDLYAENRRALEKLVSRAIKGLRNPKFFEQRTGVKQDTKNIKSSSFLAWMEVYAKTHNDKNIEKYLQKYRPMKQTKTGGNITMLYSGTEKSALKRWFNFFKYND